MRRICGTCALVALVACSSSTPPVGGGGIEAPPLQASAGLADGGADASTDGGADASASRGADVCTAADCHRNPDLRPISQRVEEDYGLTLTDRDKLILDTCPRRVWSENVPDRACTKDEECGEGFCDRGHCEVLYTCSMGLGKPCTEKRLCHGVCIDGRCLSCISDEECEQKSQELFPESTRRSPKVCRPSSLGGKLCF